MDPAEHQVTTDELVERLAGADPADAPDMADEIATRVAAALDPDGAPDEAPA